MADPVDDLLAAATSALRDRARPDDAPVEDTRRRLMASVGEGHRPRRWRVGFAVFAFALTTAGLSWAASTGRLDGVLETVGLKRAAQHDDTAVAHASGPANVRTTAPEPPAPTAMPEPIADPSPTPKPDPSPSPDPDPNPTPTPNPSRNPNPDPDPKRNPNPTPKPAVVVDDGADVASYRRAHALHFRGGAPAETLAAWDAYLAEFPRGRFAADARYNRAIVLVRLDRIDDARAALAPFAAGQVEHGYRQREAIELRDALAGQP